jgi:hypothetical protein
VYTKKKKKKKKRTWQFATTTTKIQEYGAIGYYLFRGNKLFWWKLF